MHHHEAFDFWVHDDAELSAVLGSAVTSRFDIQQWPLPVVQRLHCADGATYIYKVQAPPTVEPTFYERARSSLLPAARVLPVPNGPAALVLEDLRAPCLHDLELTQSRRLEIVDDVLTRINQIEGDVPALYDIRTKEGWDAYVELLLTNLRALVAAKDRPNFTPEILELVAERGRAAETYEALKTPTGYVHNDLLSRNVLVCEDGYRVLDWQRPIWAPVGIDRATLLESVGMDPRPFVTPGILMLRWVLRIGFWPADNPPTRPVIP